MLAASSIQNSKRIIICSFRQMESNSSKISLESDKHFAIHEATTLIGFPFFIVRTNVPRYIVFDILQRKKTPVYGHSDDITLTASRNRSDSISIPSISAGSLTSKFIAIKYTSSITSFYRHITFYQEKVPLKDRVFGRVNRLQMSYVYNHATEEYFDKEEDTSVIDVLQLLLKHNRQFFSDSYRRILPIEKYMKAILLYTLENEHGEATYTDREHDAYMHIALPNIINSSPAKWFIP